VQPRRLRTALAFAFLLVARLSSARDAIQDKNFLVLTLLERTPAVAADRDLHAILATKLAAHDCDTYRFTDDEIERAANALRHLAAVRELANTPAMRRAYVRDDDDRIAKAWIDAAHGINHIIDVYGLGKPPRYPDIDSISFDPKSEDFADLLRTMTAVVRERKFTMFFQPSLQFALHLLAINGRDEAGRFEPLDSTVNAAVLRHIPKIAWKDFRYTAILLPGYGPERRDVALSPEGRLRTELAARRFHVHEAPLIIVSGGYVHPSQTKYCEAIEMKRALVDDFGVPADAIVVEPHARHTTTNLRNAARLMARYRIPLDRPALVTTSEGHSAMIAGQPFAERCLHELGYLPATIGRRISQFDLEFIPRKESTQIDPMDPLDP